MREQLISLEMNRSLLDLDTQLYYAVANFQQYTAVGTFEQAGDNFAYVAVNNMIVFESQKFYFPIVGLSFCEVPESKSLYLYIMTDRIFKVQVVQNGV